MGAGDAGVREEELRGVNDQLSAAAFRISRQHGRGVYAFDWIKTDQSVDRILSRVKISEIFGICPVTRVQIDGQITQKN